MIEVSVRWSLDGFRRQHDVPGEFVRHCGGCEGECSDVALVFFAISRTKKRFPTAPLCVRVVVVGNCGRLAQV